MEIKSNKFPAQKTPFLYDKQAGNFKSEPTIIALRCYYSNHMPYYLPGSGTPTRILEWTGVEWRVHAEKIRRSRSNTYKYLIDGKRIYCATIKEALKIAFPSYDNFVIEEEDFLFPVKWVRKYPLRDAETLPRWDFSDANAILLNPMGMLLSPNDYGNVYSGSGILPPYWSKEITFTYVVRTDGKMYKVYLWDIQKYFVHVWDRAQQCWISHPTENKDEASNSTNCDIWSPGKFPRWASYGFYDLGWSEKCQVLGLHWFLVRDPKEGESLNIIDWA